MSKLFKLKEWVTVPDAAKRLSITLSEEVTEADIFNFALNGHLKLSGQLVNEAYGRQCVAIKVEEIEWNEIQIQNLSGGNSIIKIPKGGRVWQDESGCFQVQKNVVELNGGIWDVPLIGGERIDVEFAFHQLTDGHEVTAVSLDGVFLASKNGDLFEIQSRHTLTKEEGLKRPFLHAENFHSAGGLPDDFVFGVRTDALIEFEQSLKGEADTTDKPLSTTERNTLLKLVIGMAVKGYSHDPAASKSTAPKEIADDLAGLGITITDDTVRKYLKQAADAVLPGKPSQS